MASKPEPDQASLSLTELLARHYDLLNTHLEICSQVHASNQQASPSFQVVQTCKDNTQMMIQDLGQLQALIKNFQHDQPSEVRDTTNDTALKRRASKDGSTSTSHPTSKKRQRVDESGVPELNGTTTTQSFEDNSSFFTIDTKPTPLEELMSKSLSISQEKLHKKKRPRPGSGMPPVGAGITTMSDQDDSVPRKRSRSQSKPEDIPHEATNGNNEDYENSFLEKVASKHAQKAARRQSKAEKKRKRESNGSLDEHASGTARPRKKKRAFKPVEKDGKRKHDKQK